MIKLTQEEISARLRADTALPRPDSALGAMPHQEAHIAVTLDQLRPYDRNPRFIRNPLYQDIKASIRERGLDQPPSISRRPDEAHFIILNGGNTRLAILNELWRETREDRFFRIVCRYRPWAGEMHAILGHLAESDLHGQLAYIERALAVVAAKELLETDSEPLSQRELAHALSHGGYPVSQSQISRMFDTVQHLYPALPQALSTGLSRQEIERLVQLRKRAEQVWNRYMAPLDHLSQLWQQTLFDFDNLAEEFSGDEARTALMGQMAKALDITPRMMELELSQGTRPPAASTTATAETDSPPPRSAERKNSTATDEPELSNSPSVVSSELPKLDEEPAAPEKTQQPEPRIGTILGGIGTRDGSPQHTAQTLPSLDALIACPQAWTVEELQQAAFDLATALAVSAGLAPDSLVRDESRLGFSLQQDNFTLDPTSNAFSVRLLLVVAVVVYRNFYSDEAPDVPQAFLGAVLDSGGNRGWALTSDSLQTMRPISDAQLTQFTQLIVLLRRLAALHRPVANDEPEPL